MNNRRKTNHGKMRRGIKRRTKPFRWRLKKVRGKNNRKNTAVKVHSVSADGISISASFATYLLLPFLPFRLFINVGCIDGF